MLYNLDQNIETLLVESEGEITETIEKLLTDRDQVEKWLKGVTYAYLNEMARLEAISAELTRINQLKSDTIRKTETLKRSIGRLAGGQKADLGFAKVSFRASEGIEIDHGCEEKLPDEYLVPKWHADKARLKAALKAGVEIEHCRLVERQNVIIK